MKDIKGHFEYYSSVCYLIKFNFYCQATNELAGLSKPFDKDPIWLYQLFGQCLKRYESILMINCHQFKLTGISFKQLKAFFKHW